MRARSIVILVGGHLVVAFVLTLLVTARGGAQFGAWWQVGGLAGTLALAGLFPLRVELKRSSCAVLLVEQAVVVALFLLPPLGVALAATIGEVSACLTLRMPPLKVVYTAVTTMSAVLAAALVFALVGGPGLRDSDPAAWLAALGAMTVYLVYIYSAVTMVRSVVERRRATQVAAAGAAVYAMASLLSVAMGLMTVALYSVRPAAPLLLVPFVVAAALVTRGAATHRTEHLRFERLYAASARSTALGTLEQALANSASEARDLVTGAAAACCVPTADGEWMGMLVDDDGIRPAGPTLTAAVVDLVGRPGPREVTASAIDPAARRTVASCATVVSAGRIDGYRPIALAVFREMASDDQGDARGEVLAAFVGHAALTAANATLYADVQDALAHQVDLNRQKDEFAAAVSHELRTPLAAMLTSIATLRRLEGRLDRQATGHVLEMADRQGKRLHRLIDDLLMLAAIEQSSALMQAEPTDVAGIVAEVAEEVSRLAPNTMTIDISTDVGIVASSGTRLRQVITNLIENAVKYAGGSAIEVHGRRDEGVVNLSVIDHGQGIADKDMSRVFERFVQLDQSATRIHGGTGLGLHLCRRIADLLDGTLALTATPGGGATFTLSFPAPRLHEASLSRPPQTPARPAGSAPEPRRAVMRRPVLAASAQKGR